MGSPTKSFAFLFLSAFALFTNIFGQEQRKPEIGDTSSIQVPYVAKVAVPINFQSKDYTGPYDPADPKGIGAAYRRQARLQSQANAERIKSYIPPGLNDVMKKELIHLAVNEGRRFAVHHPKETADLAGIAIKVKNLVNDVKHTVKKEMNEKDDKDDKDDKNEKVDKRVRDRLHKLKELIKHEGESN